MGGISANKPILPLITGPMLPGSYRGKRIGACTDCRNNWAAFRAGEIDVEEISEINEELAPTVCAFADATRDILLTCLNLSDWNMWRHGHS